MRDKGGPIPDRGTLMRMATGYLARYAASSHRVRQVLERRIRRRCLSQNFEAPSAADLGVALDEVIARLQDLGLLDDRAFAAGRVRALQRKGLPARRIRVALRGEGLSQEGSEEGERIVDDAVQAQRFAARKRLGPYRTGERGPFRDKDLRSLLRAGFAYPVAVTTVDSEPDADH